MSWHHDASHSRTVGAGQHGAQVAWIGDAIADEEKRTLVLEQRSETDGLQASGNRHRALVALGASLAIEPSHRDHLDRPTLTLRLEFDGIQDVRRVLLVGHEDLLYHPAPGLQQF